MNIHSDSSYMSINVRIIQKKLMKNYRLRDWSISWKFRITTVYSFPVIYHENVLSISLLVTLLTVLFTFNFVKTRSSLGFAETHDQSLQIINFSKFLSQQIQTLPKNKLFEIPSFRFLPSFKVHLFCRKSFSSCFQHSNKFYLMISHRFN